jgi:hypothetical protein
LKLICAQKPPERLPVGKAWFSKPLVAILTFLLTTGCISLSDPETSQIHEQEIVATLQAGGTAVGQTFISRRSGLDSLTFWLASSDPNPQGSLIFELFHTPEDAAPLYQAKLPTSDIQGKRTFKISFPPQHDPPGQVYDLRLRAEGKNLEIYGRLENIYSPGAFFTDAPAEADLAFRTTYAYGWSAVQEDLSHWVKNAWLVIPLSLLLLVPGWLLLDLAGSFQSKDFGVRIAMWVGTSLAVIPVLMLWTTVLDLPWSSSFIWIVLNFLAIIQITRHRNSFSSFFRSPLPTRASLSPQRRNWMKQNITHLIVLLGIFIFTLTTRLIMVRDVATPLWVDSVHHGLITRLILEQGSYPATFSPYLIISPAEYHLGFHSLAASFVWLTGLQINEALLVLGQVLNALAVFSSYLFTVSLCKDRFAGLIAAALTGLFTPMPAYYTSWGRYTHLAGMLVLPVFLALFIQFLNLSPAPKNQPQENLLKRMRWKLIGQSLLLCLVAAGLFLLHYRVAAFGLLLALAYLFLQPKFKDPSWGRYWKRSALAALGAFLLAVPWILPFIQQILLPRLEITGTRQPFFSGFAWQYLTSGSGIATILLAIFGLVLGISLRKRFAFMLLMWVGFLFLLPNLSALGLPGGNLVNHTAVEISLYLPISLLGGYAVSFLLRMSERILSTQWRVGARWAFSILAVFLLLLGAQKTTILLNPVTFLSRQPDLAAISWIEENLNNEGIIAINPFLWGYGFYAGSDGGFWISPLTAHPTLPPPVLYGASLPEETARINHFCAQVISNAKNAQGLWDLFQQNNVRYVYLGARGGVISPWALKDSDLFQLLYTQDGTWIFEVMP